MIRPPSDTVILNLIQDLARADPTLNPDVYAPCKSPSLEILNQVLDDGIRGKRFSTLLQRRYRGELLFV